MAAPVAALARLRVVDNNGAPISGAKLFTYVAGTSTKKNTYSDSTLLVANANPMESDINGLFGPRFMASGAYKEVLAPAADTDPPTSAIYSQDNLVAQVVAPTVLSKTASYAVVTTDGDDVLVLVDATAGAITISLYTAVGASGKRVGVKKIDSSINAVTIDPSGTQTIDGSTTLTLTQQYDTALLESDSTNWQNLLRAVNVSVAPVCQGRLTATTGVPVTRNDVSAATSIFFTPYQGNQIALYDGTTWNLRSFAEITISLAALTASKPYDVFAYDNAGVVTIELLVWTNTTTRATALTTQNGIRVKTGAVTRRYLGTVYINASGGQTDDAEAKRYLWNYYNRTRRPLRVFDTTDSWTYNGAYRQANGSAANQVDVMIGVAEVMISLIASVQVAASGATFIVQVAIGEDGTAAAATECLTHKQSVLVANQKGGARATLAKMPAEGRHFYPWLETSDNNTTTWYGDDGGGVNSGLLGWVEG